MKKFQAPRGTSDVLPDDARRRRELVDSAAHILGVAGYDPIETPIFEHTELFARGVGESTDIVQKEMFTFDDKGGRSLTLRPEGTAGVCRAYIQHGMDRWPQPVKLWYAGPFFRHESPQKGRFRQFSQIGAEALGSDSAALDAEMILTLAELIERAGAGPARLRLSSLGTAETRHEYLEELRTFLRTTPVGIPDDLASRFHRNPLRAFDSKEPSVQGWVAGAPKLLERLNDADAAHFAEVCAYLEGFDIDYVLDPTLVRGLDYYNRTVFEFESPQLGAQAALGGGGRYDGLVEQLGGPPTPGVGWAAGVERLLMAGGDAQGDRPATVFVAVANHLAGPVAFRLTQFLRRQGIRVELGQANRPMRRQLSHANRVGARATVIVGETGQQSLSSVPALIVRDMRTGAQVQVEGPDDTLQGIQAILTNEATPG